MPCQYLQQICQLYNCENKFFFEFPSFCFDQKLEGMVQRTLAAMFFEKWSSSQPTTSGVKKLKFHQIKTTIYYLSSLSQIARSWLQLMLLQRLEIVLSQKLQRYIWWWTNDSRFAVQVLRTTMWQVATWKIWSFVTDLQQKKRTKKQENWCSVSMRGRYSQHKSQRTKQS